MRPIAKPLPQPLVDAAERLGALDRPAAALGRLVRGGLGRGAVKDAVSGTWLGNSVHAPLTDAVVGLLLSATVLDVLRPGDREAALRLIEAGLAAAAPTVVAGLNDWADAEPADAGIRRAGMLHAAGTGVALALYGASAAARRRGSDRRGRALGLAGLGVLTAGSYLGGHLSFRRGVGPNQTAHDPGPREWTALHGDPGPPDGRPLRAVADDTPVLVVRHGVSIHAIHDRCSHRGCSLAAGTVAGHVVTCGCHGSRFDLRDGSVVSGPATFPQPAFDVRERDGRLEVRRRPPA